VLQNGVGKNDYLNEFKLFNQWILHTGVVTWVPEVRIHTKCVIRVISYIKTEINAPYILIFTLNRFDLIFFLIFKAFNH